MGTQGKLIGHWPRTPLNGAYCNASLLAFCPLVNLSQTKRFQFSSVTTICSLYASSLE